MEVSHTTLKLFPRSALYENKNEQKMKTFFITSKYKIKIKHISTCRPPHVYIYKNIQVKQS